MEPHSYCLERFAFASRGPQRTLASSQNQYSNDVCIDTDITIVATSKEPIVYHGRNGRIDERETEMMAVRWRVFELNKKIPEEQKGISPCPHCFAELVLLDEDF